MKYRIMSLAAVLAALVAVHGLRAEDKAADAALKCPVSGKAATKDHAVKYDGAEVYFCCDNCPAEFEKNKEKYAAKAHHQEVLTGQLTEVSCPLTGKPLNEKQVVEIEGVKVAFCCGNCKAKVAAMKPDEQVEKVFKDVSKSYKVAASK